MKRYWINNSDDEEDLVAELPSMNNTHIQIKLGNSSFQTEAPEVYDKDLKGQFKDEFFPVTICKQKKWLNIEDKTRTMMHGVVE